jgi:hypothetical protein
MVDKLNINYSGTQINAEPISVPAASPYTARTIHNRILKEDPSTVEIWQNADKSGSWLTEEPYTGTVSATGKFQVDYDGVEDGDVSYRNAILFHSSQAGSSWFIWYKSVGDIYDANDFNAKIEKIVGGTEDNLIAQDSTGGVKDAGKKVSDLEPKIDPKGTAFNKNFGTTDDTVCEGDDSRLSDARTPLSHKNTHITGGSDIIPNAVSGGNSGLMSGSDKQNLDDAASKKHTQNTDQYLDFGGISQVAVADVKDAVTKKHSHSNLPLLETYTQTETNLADAVSKKHAQGTDTTLGTMTADINMNSHQLTNLGTPATAGDAIRQTVKITEAMLEKNIYMLVNEQTGTSYTLVLSDDHKLIDLNNSSAITLTIPANTSVAFPIGTQILICQKGTGQVTISPGSGVTINSFESVNKTVSQYSMAGLIKIATNTWRLFGDLE